MKFVKENLTLVICAAAAVLFLVFAFAPIPYAVPSLKAELVDQMTQRYNHKDQIKQYAGEPLVLPEQDPAAGIPPPNWVEAKKQLIKNINDQQKQVLEAAQAGNLRGRLDDKGVPVLPVPNNADPAKSTGKAEPGYLPKMTSDPMAFKSDYALQFRAWRSLLATGSLEGADEDAAMPPKFDKLKSDFDDLKKAQQAQMPPGALNSGMNTASDQETMAYVRRMVMNKAAGLHMYVETNAFQIRSWYNQDAPPNDGQVFEAFVDSWLQSDVVKAIQTVNNQALAGESEKNVGKSAIKRLTRVVIGNNARSRFISTNASGGGGGGSSADAGSPLFFVSTTAGAGAVSAPVPVNPGAAAASAPASLVALPNIPNPSDYTLGLTGRASGNTYDVAYMSVVVDIDPAYLFKFIDQLYRQNMCYTVVNIQTRAADPLDRAGNGYLYGESPVIEVELLVECILFRSWTAPLMPDAERITLGGAPPAGG